MTGFDVGEALARAAVARAAVHRVWAPSVGLEVEVRAAAGGVDVGFECRVGDDGGWSWWAVAGTARGRVERRVDGVHERPGVGVDVDDWWRTAFRDLGVLPDA